MVFDRFVVTTIDDASVFAAAAVAAAAAVDDVSQIVLVIRPLMKPVNHPKLIDLPRKEKTKQNHRQSIYFQWENHFYWRFLDHFYSHFRFMRISRQNTRVSERKLVM